eukprot:m.112145 g.112145  ORF g.112145 m.112145 type:complete len:771 (+) comp14084_c0_seq2:130-2442(+)
MGLLKRLLDGRRLGAFVLVVILGGSFNSHGVSALSVECFDPLLDFYLKTGFDITRSYELVAKDSCKSQSANIQQLLTCTHGDNSAINVSCGNHSDSTQNRKFLYGNVSSEPECLESLDAIVNSINNVSQDFVASRVDFECLCGDNLEPRGGCQIIVDRNTERISNVTECNKLAKYLEQAAALDVCGTTTFTSTMTTSPTTTPTTTQTTTQTLTQTSSATTTITTSETSTLSSTMTSTLTSSATSTQTTTALLGAAEKQEWYESTFIVGTSVGALVLVILLALLLFCCCCKKKKKEPEFTRDSFKEMRLQPVLGGDMDTWPALQREASGVLPGAPLYTDPQSMEQMAIKRGLVPKRNLGWKREVSEHVYEKTFLVPGQGKSKTKKKVNSASTVEYTYDDEPEYAYGDRRTEEIEKTIHHRQISKKSKNGSTKIQLRLHEPPEPPARPNRPGNSEDKKIAQQQRLEQKAREEAQKREEVQKKKEALAEMALAKQRARLEEQRALKLKRDAERLKREQLVTDAEERARQRKEMQRKLDMKARQATLQQYRQRQQERVEESETSFGFPENADLEELDPKAVQAAQWTDNQIRKVMDIIKRNGVLGSYNRMEITFGELFALASPTIDALSGVCKTARKYQVLWWDPSVEQLWQGLHDDVSITLLKDTHDGVEIERRKKSELVPVHNDDVRAVGVEKCAVCGLDVFPTELVRASKACFHARCFRCKDCGTALKKNDFNVSADGNHRCKKHHVQFERNRIAHSAQLYPEDGVPRSIF